MGDTETTKRVKLRPWQERFCYLYAATDNATRSYLQARPRGTVKAGTAATEAWRLLQREEIAARVAEVQQELREKCRADAKDVLRRFWMIATADPNELIEYRRLPCPQCYEGAHDLHKDSNPDCKECHGDGYGRVFVKDTRDLSPEALALYAGVKVTKDGIEVKMHDQQAALVNYGKGIGMFVEKLQVQDTTLEELMRDAVKEASNE